MTVPATLAEFTRAQVPDVADAIILWADRLVELAPHAQTQDDCEAGLAAVSAVETRAKLRGITATEGKLSAARMDLRVRLADYYPKHETSGGRGKKLTAGAVSFSQQGRAELRSLAAIPEPVREAAKAHAIETGERISERSLIREARKAQAPQTPPVPDTAAGLYTVILADPPWRYDYSVANSRAIENQYPTLDLSEIQALPIGDAIADDAILFMWATSPKLAESLSVVEAWGFTYRTCAVWVKDKIGMGYYFRQRHELLLVATRGGLRAPAPPDRPDSVIEAPRGQHSAKPAIVHDLIAAMYPEHRRLELFARRPVEGWGVWGNETHGS